MEAEELGKCYNSPQYFIQNYCHIYDTVEGGWVPFELWPAQAAALEVIHNNQLSIVLKARQIGLTWLVLAYALWCMIFRPIASILIFSKRDIDAIYLLSEDRLRGMYDRLPEWLKSGHKVYTDNAHEWSMENESTARSFPTSAGDSYTATLAIVDEADLSPDLNSLLRAVKPTIANGGKMVLLSRADKDKPISDFKKIYIDSKSGKTAWANIFLPWYVHPRRTAEWYEREKVDIESRTGSLDDLYEQYPATDSEALKPRSLDKRIPYDWLENVYHELEGDDEVGLTGLTVFTKPEDKHLYVIGADPAEGNPNSDESSATVLDLQTGEEVAVLAGLLQPNTFADYLEKLAGYYNEASVLVERNNHGHAVLLKLSEDGFEGTLNGFDGRPGWHNTTKGKALLYTHCTKVIQEKDVIIHSFLTYQQLASIVGSTLKAPEHEHDDRATSFALAQCARLILMGGDVMMMSAAVQGRGLAVEESAKILEPVAGSVTIQGRGRSSFVRTVKVIRTSTRTINENSSSLT
jgi:hypothetical protein